MSRITLESIQDVLNPDGWSIISDKYENLDSELIFECPEGHRVYTSWKKMRSKRFCPVCDNNQYKKIDVRPTTKKPNTTRILALDQATKITGWAIYDDQTLVKFGTFSTTHENEIERCNQIKMWLQSLIHEWEPDYVGLEDIQFQETSNGNHIMGVTVFQTLAHLQGILMETCFELKKPFQLCATNTWRHECGVKGKTRTDKKRSMQMLVKKWFDVTVSDDEADAIGIGYYLSKIYNKSMEVVNWE